MKRNWRASWWGWKREWKSWLKTQHSKNKNHGIGSHHFMANRWGKSENSDRIYFLGFQNHCHHEIKRHLLLGRKAMTNLDSVFKSRDITLRTKGCVVKTMVFSSSHVWMWKLDQIVLEKTLESPLDCKIKSVDPKRNQPWRFTGRTDAEVEAPIVWPPDANAGKEWGQEEKGATEDDMVGWHHWLSGHESEQTPGDSEGQGSLVGCSPWGCKESDTTERLINNNVCESNHPAMCLRLTQWCMTMISQ